MTDVDALEVPEDFLFGASTSPHQVEGDNVHSDMWALENMLASPLPEKSGRACDSYHRWGEDMDLLAGAGLTAYRFGIEWARIEPAPGVVDEQAVEHYRSMVEGALRRGLSPVVTLHHFTSPAWFAAAGGWTAPDAVAHFSRYVETVAPLLREARAVVTINEPNMVAIMPRLLSGETSSREPGVLPDPDPALADALEAAHRAAVGLLHEQLPGVPVGWSVANQCVEAITDGMERARQYQEAIEDRFLRVSVGDDFVGVQSYTRTVFGPGGRLVPPGRTTGNGWEFYPQALGWAVRHSFEITHAPVLVTENGIATSDDDARVEYLEGALAGLAGAMRDGIPVLGYLHWSLLDNYEWGSWAPRFGLIAVDRATSDDHDPTFARTPKASLAWLGRWARKGALPLPRIQGN